MKTIVHITNYEVKGGESLAPNDPKFYESCDDCGTHGGLWSLLILLSRAPRFLRDLTRAILAMLSTALGERSVRAPRALDSGGQSDLKVHT